MNKSNKTFENFKLHTSKIVCAFKDKDQAESALGALRKAGFADDEVEFFIGLEGEHDLDLEGRYHGAIHHLRRSFQHFMRADDLQLEHYEGCLLRGNHVVQVRTTHDSKKIAGEILKSAGGNHINYYGLLITERLG